MQNIVSLKFIITIYYNSLSETFQKCYLKLVYLYYIKLSVKLMTDSRSLHFLQTNNYLVVIHICSNSIGTIITEIVTDTNYNNNWPSGCGIYKESPQAIQITDRRLENVIND